MLTTPQLVSAAAIALVLAAASEIVGHWILGRFAAHGGAGSRALRATRFGFYFLLFLYSVARTMTPAIDALIHPLVFVATLFAMWVAAASIIKRRERHR